MHRFVRGAYGLAGALIRAAVAVLPDGSSKALRGLRARRGIAERYETWAAAERDRSRPLLWVHAPSVGEGLQALPVIERFRARHPDAQLAYTFFSPSAVRFSETLAADFSDYLPFDTAPDMLRALRAIRPTAIVFSKLDVWPVLVEMAVARGIPTALLSGTVPESSRRRSRLARLALGDAYSALDLAGAISDDDASRLVEMGVAGDRVIVTGDTRYDQVWKRAVSRSAVRDSLIDRFGNLRPTLVAGSTWPADESRLLAAWTEVIRVVPDARLIIAPHEVSPAHLGAIESWARSRSLGLSRTSAESPDHSDVLLVDQYGILGDLYALADIAYVGGGFHGQGLHSLLEPASYGVPVLMGSQHGDNRDAALLVANEGGARCASSGELGSRIVEWFGNAPVRRRAGECARRVVERGRGAADLSADIVDSLLEAASDAT